MAIAVRIQQAKNSMIVPLINIKSIYIMEQNVNEHALLICCNWLTNKLIQEREMLESEYNKLNEYERSCWQIHFELENASNDEIRQLKQIEYTAMYTQYIGATYTFEEHEERFEVLEFELLEQINTIHDVFNTMHLVRRND